MMFHVKPSQHERITLGPQLIWHLYIIFIRLWCSWYSWYHSFAFFCILQSERPYLSDLGLWLDHPREQHTSLLAEWRKHPGGQEKMFKRFWQICSWTQLVTFRPSWLLMRPGLTCPVENMPIAKQGDHTNACTFGLFHDFVHFILPCAIFTKKIQKATS